MSRTLSDKGPVASTRKPWFRVITMVLATVLAAGTISATTAVLQPDRAEALSGAEFDPGHIISDTNFYDSRAMTSSEIQQFLDAKIGNCLNGLCLNVATADYPGRARESSSATGQVICEAIAAGSVRISELIYRAQVACGISAKVILVTLQKEQGLIESGSARAPGTWALQQAMGMACPDTAACDSAFSGLATQIVTGTRQLKTYKAAKFGRQPGNQFVPWHPNAACGGTYVNVRNYATAALYNYTPYRPNAAALANLRGTGDACSSYGNRNFWVSYSNWFGSPTGVPMPNTNAVPLLGAVNAAGDLLIYVGDGRGGWAAATTAATGWGTKRLITVGGDFSGDGNRDILAASDTGELRIYPTDGYGGLSEGIPVQGNWSQTKFLLAPGDLTGDRRDDLIAVDVNGAMVLHPGKPSGGLAAPRALAGSWADRVNIMSVGDFNGDRKNDLMSIDGAGGLWLHAGNGLGSFGAGVNIGVGWLMMDQVMGARDFDGDGSVDLIARTTTGDLWLYRGDSRSGWRNGYKIGNGWNGMTALAASGGPAVMVTETVGFGDLDSDGWRDLLAIDKAGALWNYRGLPGGNLGPRLPISGNWSSTREFISVGDLNSDGYRDLVSFDTAGALWLHPVVGGTLGTASKIGDGWQSMARVFSPGDFNGDQIADLLAIDGSGVLWLYTGPELNVTQIGVGWNTPTAIFSPGDFDGDGANDLLVRSASGDLHNYRGNGRGSWASTFPKVGTGWGMFDHMFSPGDFDGDGLTDVMARKANGDLWLYPSNGKGDWKPWRQVGNGWNGMRFLG